MVQHQLGERNGQKGEREREREREIMQHKVEGSSCMWHKYRILRECLDSSEDDGKVDPTKRTWVCLARDQFVRTRTKQEKTHLLRKGEVLLHNWWSPVWLDWILPSKKIFYSVSVNVVNLMNANQSNWRRAIQWYFNLRWVFSGPSFSFAGKNKSVRRGVF